MSNFGNLIATREVLREMARIIKVTRQALAMMARENGRFAGGQAGQFADALEHIGDVREGFILSQRTSPQATLAQLKGLVEDILLDWHWVQQLNLTFAPSHQIETLGEQLVVYNHALVAMAVLPRLPANAITFPQYRPTYFDVTAPTLPNETLARIEEIERIIYQAEVGPVQDVPYASFRRTYAFFEASNWIIDKYLAPLLED
jgi:hypothetical protein